MARALEPKYLIDNNITEFAIQDFCLATIQILVEGSDAASILPTGPCGVSIPGNEANRERYKDLCDPQKFPEFHTEMVPTYEKLLRSLNVDVGQPLLSPIMDPTALAPAFGVVLDPIPSFPEVLAAMAIGPPGIADILGFSIPADFLAQAAVVIPKLAPTLPPIPAVPDQRLYDLKLKELIDFQIGAFTAPINAMLGLLSDIPSLILQGLSPPAIIDALCDAVSAGFSANDNEDIRKAANQAMIERAIIAAGMCAVAMSVGAGGVVVEEVATGLGAFDSADLAERVEGLKTKNAERNNIPINRNPAGVPQQFRSGVGTGLKDEVYQELKRIGSRYVTGDIDDNHKGLILMSVLFHETGMDPGAATAFDDKTGAFIIADPSRPDRVSDAQVWGLSVGAIATSVTSMKKSDFQNSPVYEPGDGMDIMTQLAFYEEWLARQLHLVGRINVENGSPNRRPNPHGPDFGRPSPDIGSIDQRFITGIGGQTINQVGASLYEPRTGTVYVVENAYDLYAFHVNPRSSGAAIVLGGSNTFTSPALPGPQPSLMYSLAERTYRMVFQEEHAQRYAEANGMPSIDWSRVVPVGLARYISPDGLTALTEEISLQGQVVKQKAMPPADPAGFQKWVGQNSDDLVAFKEKIKNRDSG